MNVCINLCKCVYVCVNVCKQGQYFFRTNFGSMYQRHSRHAPRVPQVGMMGARPVSVAFSTLQVGAAVAVYLLDVFGDAAPSRVDGIIVLDSGAKIRGVRHWTEYMAELLFHIHVATGQRCIAVAQGGLSFVEYWEATSYQYVLERITSIFVAPRFMVWVALGNDLYPPEPDMQAYETPLRRALQQFLSKALAYCPEHRFVFGGSSDVWQYSKYFPQEACKEYDRMCAMVCAYIQSQRGLYPGLGAPMLKGVALLDRIGHFSDESMGQLRVFFRMLVKWGMADDIALRSRL